MDLTSAGGPRSAPRTLEAALVSALERREPVTLGVAVTHVNRPTLLILSQVYVPDPASVGQHIADAAEEMVRRGYRVVVYTSVRGYDDPAVRYPSQERRNGVDVRRLSLSSFGKGSIGIRLLAQSLFLIQAVLRSLFTRSLCGVMVSTSPPFCGIGGVIVKWIRRVPLKYWIMDLNPDQMVAMGKLGERSPPVRVFDALNRIVLRNADDVVVLDRFMAERVRRKTPFRARLEIMPPWPHEDRLEDVAHADNPFRQEHVPPGSFVLMYSGNHSPANPIATVLDAVERLQDDPRLLMLSVGGGEGKRDVEDRICRGARNIRSLPYQPLDRLRFSLSAADVHVVSVGDGVVGIVHPCKIYGAMAVARPILAVAPRPSHVSELIESLGIGKSIAHGDVDAAVAAIRSLLDSDTGEREAMGRSARAAIDGGLGRSALLGRFCDVLQRGLPGPG
jgi:colanic acid biosynthesis glycosyl transferase WcaI